MEDSYALSVRFDATVGASAVAVLLVTSRCKGPLTLPNVGGDSCVAVTSGSCSDAARRGAETSAESARKIRVIAKAAGVGDLGERLTCFHRRAAFNQMCRMIETERRYVATACRPAVREQALQIAQRNSHLGSYLTRRDFRIGKAVLDDAAGSREQFVGVA